jgi:ribonucleoside-diphosphate reductase alpha chain
MLGVSGGIEPIFATHYTRKTESLHGEDKYYKVYTPIVQEYVNKHGEALPDYIITAQEIDAMDRVKMQSVFQKYIDASISSTVNLPESASVDDIMNIYIEAWKQGLKGITIYREGCKRDGILIKEKKKPTCPECGAEIEHTGGCVSCPECGFGMCSL